MQTYLYAYGKYTIFFCMKASRNLPGHRRYGSCKTGRPVRGNFCFAGQKKYDILTLRLIG